MDKNGNCQPSGTNKRGVAAVVQALAASEIPQAYPVPRELSFSNLVLFNTFESVLDLIDICGGEATCHQLDHKSVELQGCPICVVTPWDNIARECHRSPNPIQKICDAPLTFRNPNFGNRTAAALSFREDLLREDERRLKVAREKIGVFLSVAAPVSLDLVSDMYREKHGVALSKMEQRRLTGAENTEMFLSRLMGKNFEDSKIVYSLLPSGKYILKIIRSEEERRQHRILQPPALFSGPLRPQGIVRGILQSSFPPPAPIPISPTSSGPAPDSPPPAVAQTALVARRLSLLSPPPPPPPLPQTPSPQTPSRFPPRQPITSPEDTRESALRTALSKWKDPVQMSLTEIVILKVVARTVEMIAVIGEKSASVDRIQEKCFDFYGRSMKGVVKRLREYLRNPLNLYPFSIKVDGILVTDNKYGLKSLAQEVYVEALRAEYDKRLESLRQQILEILPAKGEMTVADLTTKYKKRFCEGTAKFNRPSLWSMADCSCDEDFCSRIEGDDARIAEIVYGKTKKGGGAGVVWFLKRAKSNAPGMTSKRYQELRTLNKKKLQEGDRKQVDDAAGSPETSSTSSSGWLSSGWTAFTSILQSAFRRGSSPASKGRKRVSSIPLPPVPSPVQEDDPSILAFVENLTKPEDTSFETLVLINTVARFVDLINRNGGTASFSEMQRLNKAVYGRAISKEMFLRWQEYTTMAERYPFKILISGSQRPILQNVHYGRKSPSLVAYLDKVRSEFDKRMELTRRRVLVMLGKYGPMDMEAMGDRYGYTFFGAAMTKQKLFGLANVDKEEEFCRRIEEDDIYEAKVIFYTENNKKLLAIANPGLIRRVFSESGIDEMTRRRFRRATEMRADKKAAGASTTNAIEAEVIDILSDDGEDEAPASLEASRTSTVPSDSTKTGADAASNPASSWTPQKSSGNSSPSQNPAESNSSGGSPTKNPVESTVPPLETSSIAWVDAAPSGPGAATTTTTVTSPSDMDIDDDDQSSTDSDSRSGNGGTARITPENAVTVTSSSSPIPVATQNGEEGSAPARKIRAVDPQLIGQLQKTVASVVTSQIPTGVREGEASVKTSSEDIGSFRTPPCSPVPWNKIQAVITPMDSSLEDGEIRSESSIPEALIPDAPIIPEEAMDIGGGDDLLDAGGVPVNVTSEVAETPTTTSLALHTESAADSTDGVTVSTQASESNVVDSESTSSLIFVDASTLIPDPPTAFSPGHLVKAEVSHLKTLDSEVPPAASSSPIKAKSDASASVNKTLCATDGGNEEKFKLASNMVLMALRDAERRGEDTDAIIHRMFAALYGK